MIAWAAAWATINEPKQEVARDTIIEGKGIHEEAINMVQETEGERKNAMRPTEQWRDWAARQEKGDEEWKATILNLEKGMIGEWNTGMEGLKATIEGSRKTVDIRIVVRKLGRL